MTSIIRWGMAGIVLLFGVAGIAAEYPTLASKNAVPKTAIDSLLARLESISHDRDMTTAKKTIVAAEEMEKFNRQFKGKPLIVRLKIQDVVPGAEGHCLTANRPDLNGVQSYTGKFQATLSNAEVMSVTKESVLVVTGLVSASTQPKPAGRSSEILKPGSSIAFALRANPACQICLDNLSYQLEALPKTGPLAHAATTNGSETLADKDKNEQLRSVDDIKLYFLKGILQAQHTSGSATTGATAKPGTNQSYGSNTRAASGYGANSNSSLGSAKFKHNRIYTAAEIVLKFGNPSARSSKATVEEWTYKCKDGVVHVHFTQVGYSRSFSTSKSETLKLEIKSVDSSSSNRSL